MKNKKASMVQKYLIQIIIIGILFAAFFVSLSQRDSARGVKQQILEKQTALLIEAASPGMTFEISRSYLYGHIDSLKIQDNRVYVKVDGLPSNEGYLFVSPYNVRVETTEDKYLVEIYE